MAIAHLPTPRPDAHPSSERKAALDPARRSCAPTGQAPMRADASYGLERSMTKDRCGESERTVGIRGRRCCLYSYTYYVYYKRTRVHAISSGKTHCSGNDKEETRYRSQGRLYRTRRVAKCSCNWSTTGREIQAKRRDWIRTRIRVCVSLFGFDLAVPGAQADRQ